MSLVVIQPSLISLPFAQGRLVFEFDTLLQTIRDYSLLTPLSVIRLTEPNKFIVADGISRFYACLIAFPNRPIYCGLYNNGERYTWHAAQSVAARIRSIHPRHKKREDICLS